MCKVKDYPELYKKARGIVRVTRINNSMPGYEMLIKAIVICKVQGTEDLYSETARETSVVPVQRYLTRDEKKRHPVEQMILEAMRSSGIEDSVMDFIQKLANQI